MNDCPYSFKHLSAKKIPDLLKDLKKSIKSPWTYNDFKKGKIPTIRALSKDDKKGYSGCYIFFHEEGYEYVGISRNLPGRVWDHFNGKTQHHSSFIYKVARNYPEISNMQKLLDSHKKRPKGLHNQPKYRKEFSKARKVVQTWKVAYVRIDDPVTLYIFEVAASMQYNTHLNCFRTH